MTKKYTAVIDIDTLIVHSALAGQTSSVIVTHKDTGWSKEFKNQTEFFGAWQKKDGGWLAEVNAKKVEKGLEPVSPDAFTVETKVDLIPDHLADDGTIITPEIVVKGRFKSKIEFIANQDWCKDFKICYGIGKNFRYDIAETVPYKNARVPKPILFDVVRDYMLWKYKDHLITAENVETDDIMTQEMWKAWLRSGRNIDKLDTVACFIDKDLAQFPCLQYNFDKPELGLVPITPLQAAKNLAVQMLMGDAIDTIPGLPALPEELCKKYKLRKTKGLGETTAKGVVSDAQDAKDVFERVVEAYKLYYGEARMQFVSHDGVFTDRNWLDHMNEMFRLLRMRSDITKDAGHVKDFLSKLGIGV
jgi:hypothetical protein